MHIKHTMHSIKAGHILSALCSVARECRTLRNFNKTSLSYIFICGLSKKMPYDNAEIPSRLLGET